MTAYRSGTEGREAQGRDTGAWAAPGQDFLLLVGRVMIGGVFLVGGLGKLMAIGAFAAGLARNGLPQPVLLAYLGGLVEFVGGLALVIGLAARYAAALLILFVIVATAISHRYWEFADPQQRRMQTISFTKNVMIAGGLVLACVVGAGRIALDRLLRRNG